MARHARASGRLLLKNDAILQRRGNPGDGAVVHAVQVRCLGGDGAKGAGEASAMTVCPVAGQRAASGPELGPCYNPRRARRRGLAGLTGPLRERGRQRTPRLADAELAGWPQADWVLRRDSDSLRRGKPVRPAIHSALERLARGGRVHLGAAGAPWSEQTGQGAQGVPTSACRPGRGHRQARQLDFDPRHQGHALGGASVAPCLAHPRCPRSPPTAL